MLPYSNVITKIYDEKDTVAGQYNDCLENFLGKRDFVRFIQGWEIAILYQ